MFYRQLLLLIVTNPSPKGWESLGAATVFEKSCSSCAGRDGPGATESDVDNQRLKKYGVRFTGLKASAEKVFGFSLALLAKTSVVAPSLGET